VGRAGFPEGPRRRLRTGPCRGTRYGDEPQSARRLGPRLHFTTIPAIPATPGTTAVPDAVGRSSARTLNLPGSIPTTTTPSCPWSIRVTRLQSGRGSYRRWGRSVAEQISKEDVEDLVQHRNVVIHRPHQH